MNQLNFYNRIMYQVLINPGEKQINKKSNKSNNFFYKKNFPSKVFKDFYAANFLKEVIRHSIC